MGQAGPSVPVGRRGGLGPLGRAEHLGGGASRRTGPFLNLATVLIRWFLLQTLDRGPVDEDVDEFGLEAVAHIEGLGLVGTGSRSGERSARAGARRPRSGDPCVDALALD